MMFIENAVWSGQIANDAWYLVYRVIKLTVEGFPLAVEGFPLGPFYCPKTRYEANN